MTGDVVIAMRHPANGVKEHIGRDGGLAVGAGSTRSHGRADQDNSGTDPTVLKIIRGDSE
jgi:hypothetical protein